MVDQERHTAPVVRSCPNLRVHASSTLSERVFSTAGDTMKPERSENLPENADMFSLLQKVFCFYVLYLVQIDSLLKRSTVLYLNATRHTYFLKNNCLLSFSSVFVFQFINKCNRQNVCLCVQTRIIKHLCWTCVGRLFSHTKLSKWFHQESHQ